METTMPNTATSDTIKDLTNGDCSELKVGYAGTCMVQIKMIINKILAAANSNATLLELTTAYDIATEDAIKQCQSLMNMSATGILDTATYQGLKLKSNEEMSDEVESDEEPEETPTTETENTLSHYHSFFNEDNQKDTRVNGKDIIISIGSGLTKTIKDVYMRSTGIQIDTSGNPIAETFEFIGRDVIESDEPEDELRDDTPAASTSKTKHVFHFGKTDSSAADGISLSGDGQSTVHTTDDLVMGGGGKSF